LTQPCTYQSSFSVYLSTGLPHGKISVHVVLGRQWDPISEIIRSKSSGCKVHVIECLSSKCEALGSKPSIKKKKLYFFFYEELCPCKLTCLSIRTPSGMKTHGIIIILNSPCSRFHEYPLSCKP
jgi:hypothetical protein